MEADDKVVEFLKGRTTEKYEIVKSDADAVYEKVYQIDGSKLEPMVACGQCRKFRAGYPGVGNTF